MNGKLNNKGFTLVELLATIAVLSLVILISIYVSVEVIDTAKTKSYMVTKNEIEKQATNYLIENSNRLFFEPVIDGKEYYCITVENLIDMGYFKNKILKSKKSKNDTVKANDYIYVLRDSNTKTLISTTYNNSDLVEEECRRAFGGTGSILFSYEPDGWSREKKVKIIYKLRNAGNINNYSYGYKFLTEEKNDKNKEKEFVIYENGKIDAYIKYLEDNSILDEQSLSISKIDNKGPVVNLGNYQKGYVYNSVTVPLILTDNGSGVCNDNCFTKDDIEVSIGGVKVTDFILTKVNDNNYNLKIDNDSLNGQVMITIKDGSIYDRVVDIEKNKNSIISLNPEISFDNEAPVITLGTNGSSYQKSISSKITVTDDHSGGDTTTYKYIYSTDNTASPTLAFTSGNSYEKSDGTGDYYLIVKACDKAGNCTTKKSNVFKLDNSAPVITLGTNGSSSYQKSVSSKITVTDNHSGGDTTTYKYIYSTDNTASPTLAFTSGSSYSQSSATGNCTTKKSNVFKLDNTNPTCSISKSNVGSQSGVTLSISCSDNSGTCTTSKTKVTGVKKGDYTYTVTDGVGNTNTCSTSVSSYSCNSYQYACGSYKCGVTQGEPYECGQNCSANCCYRYGSYICGEWECGSSCKPIMCTEYLPKYCTSYCTGYKTCYK